MENVAGTGGAAMRANVRSRSFDVSATAGAVLVATGLAGLLSIFGADLRWLAALGDAVVRAGGIPDGVPYAAAPTAQWPNVPVLGELLFHGLFTLGPHALLAAQLLAVAIALSATAIGARALGALDGQAAIVILIAAVAVFPAFAIMRAQLCSLAFFPLLMLLLRSETKRSSRRIWLAPPVLALWTNLHGAVLVGLGVFLIYLALQRFRRAPIETFSLAVAACLACCLAPALWRTPTYFHGVLVNEFARRGVGFWGPLSIHSPFDVVLAIGAIILLVLALRVGATRWELVTFLALSIATVHASRTGVFLVLAVAPRSARRLPGGAVHRRVALMAAAIGTATLLGALAHGPTSTDAGTALIGRAVTAAHGTPILAEDVLAEQVALAGGRIWIGNPIDAFRLSDQSAYVDWLQGQPAGDAELAHTDVVLVSLQSRAERRLETNPAFAELASDRHAKLFVRRSQRMATGT